VAQLRAEHAGDHDDRRRVLRFGAIEIKPAEIGPLLRLRAGNHCRAKREHRQAAHERDGPPEREYRSA
jgi:hypothetical protein